MYPIGESSATSWAKLKMPLGLTAVQNLSILVKVLFIILGIGLLLSLAIHYDLQSNETTMNETTTAQTEQLEDLIKYTIIPGTESGVSAEFDSNKPDNSAHDSLNATRSMPVVLTPFLDMKMKSNKPGTVVNSEARGSNRDLKSLQKFLLRQLMDKSAKLIPLEKMPFKNLDEKTKFQLKEGLPDVPEFTLSAPRLKMLEKYAPFFVPQKRKLLQLEGNNANMNTESVKEALKEKNGVSSRNNMEGTDGDEEPGANHSNMTQAKVDEYYELEDLSHLEDIMQHLYEEEELDELKAGMGTMEKSDSDKTP